MYTNVFIHNTPIAKYHQCMWLDLYILKVLCNSVATYGLVHLADLEWCRTLPIHIALLYIG